ncbi:MAG: hypothetical protein M0027_08890, partial [Candidatus Dormibacteraeota bacterium]|nr:hypothetical protein [Candidatus Dormibacteraeota bacterium]
CSRTSFTARSRSSCGYLVVLVISPSSQRMESPTFPGRFMEPVRERSFMQHYARHPRLCGSWFLPSKHLTVRSGAGLATPATPDRGRPGSGSEGPEGATGSPGAHSNRLSRSLRLHFTP